MLGLACEFGNTSAARLLFQIEILNPEAAASAKARSMIEELAGNPEEWEAQVLHAQHLLRSGVPSQAKKDKAYRLAKTAFAVTEAGALAPPLLKGTADLKDPWRLLRDITDMRLEERQSAEDEDVWEKAIAAGALEFHDPEACGLLAELPNQVKPYSDQWLELTTKAAMSGNKDASFYLAKYYFELYGWYPCPKMLDTESGNERYGPSKASREPESFLGFDWLELSAAQCLHDPIKMGLRFIVIALVWRENNLASMGQEYLEFGRDQIEASPVDAAAKALTLQNLNSYIDSWKNRLPYQVTAAKYLKEPRMVSATG